MPTTTHLRLHRRLWRYDRYISPELRPFMPEGHRGTRYRVYLKTGDVGVAIRLRPRLDAQFAEMIEQARMKRQGVADPLKWHIPQGEQQSVQHEIQHEALNAVLSIQPAQVTLPVEIPSIITVDQYLEEWLDRSKHLHPKTLLERRTTIKNLTEWLTVQGVGDLRTVTRLNAKGFSKAQDGKAVSTFNKVLQAVRGYWAFLKDEGVKVDADIWNGLSQRRSRREELQDKERPFSNEELVKLWRGSPSPRLIDMMTIGLLTGMRLAEIGDLRVHHVDLSRLTVQVPGTKTGSASRIIPLHPSLVKLMTARTKGKSSREYIIEELGDGADLKYGRKRSGKITMEFMRYRNSVGVDDSREGKRRSLTNFHSLRRTADKFMIEAGVPPHVIDQFFGWKDLSVMRSRYAINADLLEQMRKAVLNLRLPK